VPAVADNAPAVRERNQAPRLRECFDLIELCGAEICCVAPCETNQGEHGPSLDGRWRLLPVMQSKAIGGQERLRLCAQQLVILLEVLGASKDGLRGALAQLFHQGQELVPNTSPRPLFIAWIFEVIDRTQPCPGLNHGPRFLKQGPNQMVSPRGHSTQTSSTSPSHESIQNGLHLVIPMVSERNAIHVCLSEKGMASLPRPQGEIRSRRETERGAQEIQAEFFRFLLYTTKLIRRLWANPVVHTQHKRPVSELYQDMKQDH